MSLDAMKRVADAEAEARQTLQDATNEAKQMIADAESSGRAFQEKLPQSWQTLPEWM